MSSERLGNFAKVFERALSYLEGKGQIYSARNFALLYLVSELISDFWGVRVELLDRYADKVIALSQIERSMWRTVAQENVRSVFEGLKQEVTIQELQPERLRLLQIAREKK
ncbi:MAG: hypothetical protein QW512_02025 [Thermofilaceae archaeon]